jgi:hypothetical protein
MHNTKDLFGRNYLNQASVNYEYTGGEEGVRL